MNANFASFRKGALLLFLSIFCLNISLQAAPRRSFDDDVATREMRDGIDALRYEVENHEVELRMTAERVDNQEATLSALRQQVLDANQANKDLLKGSSANWETRIAATETANKNLVADLQKIKNHANELAEALSQYQQKLAGLEKQCNQQNENIGNLQTALRNLTDALLLKEGASNTTTVASGRSYKVKAGDSLEKIAKANGTTVSALKNLNNLSNDRIVIGQTLQLP